MPMINGKYYANPAYGSYLERSRLGELLGDRRGEPAQPWSARLIDHLTQPRDVNEPPPSPTPPGMPPEAWDDMKINKLKVRDVANNIANENHDVTPGKSSPKDLQEAKIAQGHAIINADRAFGSERDKFASTAPKEITPSLESSPQYKQAQDAARTAFQQQLAGKDPTGGRKWFNNRDSASTAPRHLSNGDQTVFQQMGPFQLGRQQKYTVIYNDPVTRARQQKKK